MSSSNRTSAIAADETCSVNQDQQLGLQSRQKTGSKVYIPTGTGSEDNVTWALGKDYNSTQTCAGIKRAVKGYNVGREDRITWARNTTAHRLVLASREQ